MLSEAVRRIDGVISRFEKPVSTGPISGAELSWTQERVEIQALCEAGDAVGVGGTSFQDLLDIDGIELLEEYDPENTENCVGYALGRVMDEDWAKDYYAVEELEKNAYKVLRRHGFELVSGEPNSGDVIVYGFSGQNLKKSLRVNHVGIYQGEGMVQSKFSEGPVLQHRWDQVPFYGDKVFFFRKK